MNALLRDAPTVKTACAALERSCVVSFELSNGPDGDTVHWTMLYDDTLQMSLHRHPAPDVRYSGSWRRMMHAASAEGLESDAGLACCMIALLTGTSDRS